MIGQEKLKNLCLNLFKENKLSKTIILNAPKGYGKKEFIKWFSQETNIPYKIFSNKIDDIREAINCSLNEYTLQIYAFEDLTSILSQNAILKFLEEPPKNVYIFLLTNDLHNLLTTIQNRGIILNFEPYTREELSTFNTDQLALDIFSNPKDLIAVKALGLKDLYDITNKIIDKLDIAGISNALKLNTYIKYKDSSGNYNKEDGYDIDLFLKVLKYNFLMKYKDNLNDVVLRKYNTFESSLKHLKVNQKYLLDNFLIKNYMENKKWNF